MRAVACCLLLIGCATDAADPTDPDTLVPDAPIPTTTGSYASAYRVPVSPELEAAATFTVDHVEWTVAGDLATLHYNLPDGLVGGKLDVTFTARIAPGATSVELTGAQGRGTCVATATSLVCHEVFANLGALPIDPAIVDQMAALEYSGPLIDRQRVASQFASEPIGFVELALDQPVIDDHGGDN